MVVLVGVRGGGECRAAKPNCGGGIETNSCGGLETVGGKWGSLSEDM